MVFELVDDINWNTNNHYMRKYIWDIPSAHTNTHNRICHAVDFNTETNTKQMTFHFSIGMIMMSLFLLLFASKSIVVDIQLNAS